MKKTPTIITHALVPKHTKLSDKEKEELLAKYNIIPSQLPSILKNDPMIKPLGLEVGDIIKIDRESKTAKKSIYYRAVING
jgi:DNA-directed RNA polymerase subunit H